MENPQWPAKYEQSAATTGSESADNLNNVPDKEEAGEGAANEDPEGVVNGTGKDKPKESQVNYIVSEKSKQTIRQILEKIKSLSQLEQYLLHLKISEISNGLDPLRQPLNPLGSRSEIHRTISWIKTHLEEDPDTSLPKQEVYDEYHLYCSQNNIKPLSQADFGKVMKQVYPSVRARRLGTRGNSRYCYSGLRRCLKLKPPILPDLADKTLSTEAPCTQSSLMAAAWLVIKKWTETQFGVSFASLPALATYLMINHSVSIGSDAANELIVASETSMKGDGKGGNKHREMQLQLQRKIQQKQEVNKERKRKNQSPKCEQKSNGKRAKQGAAPPPVACSIESPPLATTTTTTESSTNDGTESASTSPTQGKSICDKALDFTQLPALPDFNSFQKPVVCEQNSPNGGSSGVAAKVAIPRLSSGSKVQQSPQQSPKKPAKNAKYKAIQPKPQPCDIASYNPQNADIRSQDVNNLDRFKEKKISDNDDDGEAPVFPLPRERLNSISNVDKDAMDEYLGTNNSQHEEELSKYFSNNLNDTTTDSDNTTKLSQLRQLLEQNGISDNKTNVINIINGTTTTAAVINDEIQISDQVTAQLANTAVAYVPQTAQTTNSVQSHARRRVSFETPIQENGVPPSPNTRRKNFSFTPISPGPQSPTGRQSKNSSANVSPFVSPRNTPGPRIKNNTHQNAGIMLASTGGGAMRKNCAIKIKKEPDLSLEILSDVKDINFVNYMPMSAPASPMLNSKSVLQKLLNSNSKVAYTPDYVNTALQPDNSAEMTNFFDNQSNLSELTYRSQSVPLHQMVKSNFPIDGVQFVPNLSDQNANDFNDVDPIQENESVTVNRIISALDDQHCENGNIDVYNMDINPNNQCLSAFGLIINNNLEIPNDFAYENQAVAHPTARSHARSQSIDLNVTGEAKYNPSRSVPSTPLPFAQRVKLHSAKNFANQSSRSYPSTPLLAVSEPFTYDLNVNGDCLLNGQPIRMNGLDDGEGELAGNLNYFIPQLAEMTENNIEGHLRDDEFENLERTLPGDGFDIGENDGSLVDDNGILIGEQNGNIN